MSYCSPPSHAPVHSWVKLGAYDNLIPTFECGHQFPAPLGKNYCRQIFPMTLMFRCFDCDAYFCKACLIIHCQESELAAQDRARREALATNNKRTK